MGAGIEIPFHEAIVFNLNRASADCLLEQYPSGIFLIGKQFVDSFPVPFGLSSGRGNTLLLQPSSNLPKAVTSKIPFKYPAYYFILITNKSI